MSVNKTKDYTDIFETETGQRVLADLMETFHMSHSSHVASNPHETAFREGERHVVLHILSKLGKRSDPSWFVEMSDKSASQYITTNYYDSP